jgi:hypothetical protein
MDKKDKEFIDKLKDAGKVANFFSLKLEYNNKIIVAKRDFPADKYSPESIEKSSLHFLMVDCVRKIQEELRKNEQEISEKIKKEQMDKLWDNINKKDDTKP